MDKFHKHLLTSARIAFRSLSPIISMGLLVSLSGCGSDSSTTGGTAAGALPDIIALPAGFQPEGVAISGNSLFVGSIPGGRIFKADILTGQGQVLVESIPGRNSIGLKVDSLGRLFVAGGQTGQAYVYDSETGVDIEVYDYAGTGFDDRRGEPADHQPRFRRSDDRGGERRKPLPGQCKVWHREPRGSRVFGRSNRQALTRTSRNQRPATKTLSHEEDQLISL